jgi:hypothetical protein
MAAFKGVWGTNKVRFESITRESSIHKKAFSISMLFNQVRAGYELAAAD